MIKKSILSIVIGIICLVLAAVILLLPKNNNTSVSHDLSEYNSVSTICELATLRSFYHNVAMYEEKPQGGDKFFNDVFAWPFGELVNKGYKQLWMEYTGVVESGIDAEQIQIKDPSAQGIVEVYIPEAKVLNVYADESSLSEPIRESGLFTTITGEEKAEAFAKAQATMRQEAEADQKLLRRAQNNAKILLERYIINTGKEMGKDYSVKWISEPI